MSRRKEILESQFVDGEWEELMSNLNTDISPSVYLAMEKYAKECCEASVQKAFENSLFDWNIVSRNHAEEYRKSVINTKNIILL